MESNLPYDTATLSPWRAGTPGRAPRNWQAVVCNGRPLCLFIGIVVTAAVFLFTATQSLLAQGFSQRPSVQLRIGAFAATALVKDAVASSAVDDSIPGARSNEVTIRQQPGPIGTLALRLPLRSATQLEVNASVGRSTVRGDDDLESWDVGTVTVGNLVVGFGYLYRGALALRAGVGMTRLFAEDRGMFTKGNSIKPLIEAGASTAINAGIPLDIDLRVQSHSFSTATLRDNGGSGGNVVRAQVQIGTTVWGGR